MGKNGISRVIFLVLILTLVLLSLIIFWNILIALIKEKTGQIDIDAFSKRLASEQAKSLANAGLNAQGEECISEWKCGEWSKCEVVYGLGEVIEEAPLLHGEMQRECEDLNKCAPNSIETQKCETKTSINVQKVIISSKEYLEIRDEDNTLISRLELTGTESNVLNIRLYI